MDRRNYLDEDEEEDMLTRLGVRPTITRRRWIKYDTPQTTMEGSPQTGYYPHTRSGYWESYDTPYYSGYEQLDRLRRDFGRQPLTYRTDPVTGKIIATRSMARPDYLSPWAGWQVGGGDLSANWVLPQGALTGPKFIQRNAPASDYDRQMAYTHGVSNVGNARSRLNPLTYWPSSAFKLPTTKPIGEKKSVPVFGSTIDYSTGKFYNPIRSGYAEPYGNFNMSRKTPPTMSSWDAPRTSMLFSGGLHYQNIDNQDISRPKMSYSEWLKQNRRRKRL